MSYSDEHATETRPIAALRPHPRQHELFRAPLQCEVDELAADLKKNGLHTSVEILPDGTILAGHTRVAAAKLLSWTVIRVWVRHDLADKPDLAAARLVEDNLNRRQLGRMEIARCYRALKSAGRQGRSHISSQDHQDLRDQIGRRLGASGRTLDRYLRILEGTPQEVQDAVAADQLGITLAERVVGLPRKKRDKIAAEIRAGGSPSAIVRKHITPTQPRNNSQSEAYRELRVLERCVTAIEQIHAANDVGMSAEEIAVIDRVCAVTQLLRRRHAK